MPESILIVEDDPVQRRLLQATVTRAGHEAILAEHGEAALELLADSSAQEGISVVVLDLMMPGIDGIEVLNAMQDREISSPVIVQTAQGGIETVVSAMRAGAFDFVVKPVSPERLVTAIANALKLGKIERQVRQKRKPATADFDFDDIVCASPAMHRVLETGRKAASSRIPVLIEGESGVGKELIARAIQGSSPRKGKPFVTVNCGALPENLVESILFGHEKGAFTGATDKHVGKFEEANGGTLFLDEIGELPLDIQVKLLRAIQEGEIDPVGAKKPVKALLLNFAASYCGPCKKELPELQKISERYASRGVVFAVVIIDKEAGVYPMVGPGLSYRDMITGDFIPNRYGAEEPEEPDASERF